MLPKGSLQKVGPRYMHKWEIMADLAIICHGRNEKGRKDENPETALFELFCVVLGSFAFFCVFRFFFGVLLVLGRF